MSESNILLII